MTKLKEDIIKLQELGLSLAKIADKCRVSENTIRRWSKGVNLPNPIVQRMIAGMLKAKRRESCQQ